MRGRERVLAALDGRPVDHLPLMPITMMFAADQVGARYGDYVVDYRILVDAQIATARRFGLDHVSAVSDPAREAADLGASIERLAEQPPAIREDLALLGDKTTLAVLDFPNPLGTDVSTIALMPSRCSRTRRGRLAHRGLGRRAMRAGSEPPRYQRADAGLS